MFFEEMSKVMEGLWEESFAEGWAEGFAEGWAESQTEGRREQAQMTARNLSVQGLSLIHIYVLKKAQFQISEKRPYVDMEFNSFAIRYVDTLKYYDLDIYRYLIGREGQTVSRDFWKRCV